MNDACCMYFVSFAYTAAKRLRLVMTFFLEEFLYATSCGWCYAHFGT